MSLSMFVPKAVTDAWKQVDNAVTAAVKFGSDFWDRIAKGQTPYEITIITGDKRAAGTDANVFITIVGETNTAPRQKLSAKLRNLFERGQKDTFNIECSALGEIQKIILEHDGTGIGSGWYVESVSVKNLRNNKVWLCQVDDWLEADKSNEGKAIKELIPQ